MKLSRDIALKIHWVFDQLVPPVLRDQKWFMYIPIRMAFRHKAKHYFDFKFKAHELTDEEFKALYKDVSEVMFERETDLNRRSIELIQQHVKGHNVLEVGCGGGYLSRLLSEKYSITAFDINISDEVKSIPGIKFVEGNLEALPFADKEFDTVVCTHTLEHVLNLQPAIRELRRVARNCIIIVPRQRPYKYTFDMHINFFPYDFTFLNVMKPKNQLPARQYKCLDADGDIFYFETEEN